VPVVAPIHWLLSCAMRWTARPIPGNHRHRTGIGLAHDDVLKKCSGFRTMNHAGYDPAVSQHNYIRFNSRRLMELVPPRGDSEWRERPGLKYVGWGEAAALNWPGASKDLQ